MLLGFFFYLKKINYADCSNTGTSRTLAGDLSETFFVLCWFLHCLKGIFKVFWWNSNIWLKFKFLLITDSKCKILFHQYSWYGFWHCFSGLSLGHLYNCCINECGSNDRDSCEFGCPRLASAQLVWRIWW